MKNHLFSGKITVESSVKGMIRCLEYLKEIENDNLFDPALSFKIYTIFVEAVENAMFHGNKGKLHLTVDIEFYIDENEITLIVTDCGDGFDINQITEFEGVNRHKLTKEGGRGLHYIKLLSKSCTTNDKGNSLIVKIDRHGH